MNKINSRNKGARGEREFSNYLKNMWGILARRGQQFSGGTDSPDVVTELDQVHFEVKRVEKFNCYRAMMQAVRDAGEKIPVVAHRKNHSDWLIIIRGDDVERFSKCFVETKLKKSKTL